MWKVNTTPLAKNKWKAIRCKLSITSHLMYSPQSQKSYISCVLTCNEIVLKAFWVALPRLQSSNLARIKFSNSLLKKKKKAMHVSTGTSQSIKRWLPLLPTCVRACLIVQSYPTLWDPMNCSPPGSSVHGILQATILEWVAIPFSRGSSQPWDQSGSPAL